MMMMMMITTYKKEERTEHTPALTHSLTRKQAKKVTVCNEQLKDCNSRNNTNKRYNDHEGDVEIPNSNAHLMMMMMMTMMKPRSYQPLLILHST